jgi:hypothetical protein
MDTVADRRAGVARATGQFGVFQSAAAGLRWPGGGVQFGRVTVHDRVLASISARIRFRSYRVLRGVSAGSGSGSASTSGRARLSLRTRTQTRTRPRFGLGAGPARSTGSVRPVAVRPRLESLGSTVEVDAVLVDAVEDPGPSSSRPRDRDPGPVNIPATSSPHRSLPQPFMAGFLTPGEPSGPFFCRPPNSGPAKDVPMKGFQLCLRRPGLVDLPTPQTAGRPVAARGAPLLYLRLRPARLRTTPTSGSREGHGRLSGLHARDTPVLLGHEFSARW